MAGRLLSARSGHEVEEQRWLVNVGREGSLQIGKASGAAVVRRSVRIPVPKATGSGLQIQK